MADDVLLQFPLHFHVPDFVLLDDGFCLVSGRDQGTPTPSQDVWKHLSATGFFAGDTNTIQRSWRLKSFWASWFRPWCEVWATAQDTTPQQFRPHSDGGCTLQAFMLSSSRSLPFQVMPARTLRLVEVCQRNLATALAAPDLCNRSLYALLPLAPRRRTRPRPA